MHVVGEDLQSGSRGHFDPVGISVLVVVKWLVRCTSASALLFVQIKVIWLLLAGDYVW